MLWSHGYMLHLHFHLVHAPRLPQCLCVDVLFGVAVVLWLSVSQRVVCPSLCFDITLLSKVGVFPTSLGWYYEVKCTYLQDVVIMLLGFCDLANWRYVLTNVMESSIIVAPSFSFGPRPAPTLMSLCAMFCPVCRLSYGCPVFHRVLCPLVSLFDTTLLCKVGVFLHR
jgi:hypothetical protein